MKSFIFWDIATCNLLEVNRYLEGASIFTLVSSSAYSSTLKMEAIYSSEMSVDFQWTTWRRVPGDRTLRNHRCDNLKSYMLNS
jgi:hypothetical protein